MSDGFKGIKKGVPYILPVSVIMAVVQYFTILFDMYSLATLITALSGLSAMFILYKFRTKPKAIGSFYAGKLTSFQSVYRPAYKSVAESKPFIPLDER